jgi:hypothetical protein
MMGFSDFPCSKDRPMQLIYIIQPESTWNVNPLTLDTVCLSIPMDHHGPVEIYICICFVCTIGTRTDFDNQRYKCSNVCWQTIDRIGGLDWNSLEFIGCWLDVDNWNSLEFIGIHWMLIGIHWNSLELIGCWLDVDTDEYPLRPF